MHELLVSLGAVGALAFSLAGSGNAPRPTEPMPAQILDERQADVLEDAPGSRVVAAVRGRLVSDPDGSVRLELSCSPEGPRVDPPPGAYGVRGSNRITADELAALLAAGRLALSADGPQGTLVGRLRPGLPCAVLERRFEADGRVTHEPLAGAQAPRVLEADVRLAAEGLYDVALTADGAVRLRARCRVGRGTARFLALESVPAHDGRRP